MKHLTFPTILKGLRGEWVTVQDINVTDVRRHDIYQAPQEPSYVSWAILWKERTGTLKLSFVEVTGDKTAWPPTYNFNSRDIEYYLKTLVSDDGGKTWVDTGWREDLDPLWERNSDHHIRYVSEMSDGILVRNYSHTLEGVTRLSPLYVHDEIKENAGISFPFSFTTTENKHSKFASIWTSGDGGESWKEIYLFDEKPCFITAIHSLRDGTLIALGGFHPPGSTDAYLHTGFISESKDGGKTWSDPVVIAENDDKLNPQGFCEEGDFVELDDGRLLVIWRSDAPGSCMRQAYLNRDKSGIWHTTPPEINPFFVHSGYPYMYRASDGTIFYYCHASMKYSCDDGKTWGELPLGYSYYGQLTEVSPGRMLAVTQKNIGDCPYPWKHDVSLLQTTFSYERIGVTRQCDENASGALAMLDVGNPQDFHVAMELKVDAAVGMAYQVTDTGYRFVAITIPANSSRLPVSASSEPTPFLSAVSTGSEPQNAFLQIGEVEGDKTRILRKIGVGKMVPGAWAELQVSREGDHLRIAVDLCTSAGWGATYIDLKDEAPAACALALFTNKSTGAFRNVRFSAEVESIRTNWFRAGAEEARRIAIDQGKSE